MLTKSTTTIETIDSNAVNIGGHEVACTWDANGAHVKTESLKAIADAGHANWSVEEMSDIAYNAEVLLDQTYSKAYDIVTYEGFNKDRIHVLESIRMTDNAAANAYANERYAGQEWYVLDANGDNING